MTELSQCKFDQLALSWCLSETDKAYMIIAACIDSMSVVAASFQRRPCFSSC